MYREQCSQYLRRVSHPAGSARADLNPIARAPTPKRGESICDPRATGMHSRSMRQGLGASPGTNTGKSILILSLPFATTPKNGVPFGQANRSSPIGHHQILLSLKATTRKRMITFGKSPSRFIAESICFVICQLEKLDRLRLEHATKEIGTKEKTI